MGVYFYIHYPGKFSRSTSIYDKCIYKLTNMLSSTIITQFSIWPLLCIYNYVLKLLHLSFPSICIKNYSCKKIINEGILCFPTEQSNRFWKSQQYWFIFHYNLWSPLSINYGAIYNFRIFLHTVLQIPKVSFHTSCFLFWSLQISALCYRYCIPAKTYA